MILYAFNKVKSNKITQDKSFEKDLTASDVIIELFIEEIITIIKKGIFRSYSDIHEESIFIKGKIDLKKSFKSIAAKKQIIHDEYNNDNNINMIMKYTLNNLLFSNIHDRYKKKIKSIYPLFQDIPYKIIDDDLYKNIVLNRSNLFYDFALRLSVFINKKIIPSDKLGKHSFINIEFDDETMSTIYEEFLRNFYKIHTNYKVSSKEYAWYLEPFNNSDIKYLPKMITDIELLIDEDTKIIIDAKYYKNALSSRYDIKKFSSNNMYQLNTYLEHNLEYKNLRGILLYPCVGYYFDEKYIRRDRYTIEFRTIDLNQNWKKIERDLLEMI